MKRFTGFFLLSFLSLLCSLRALAQTHQETLQKNYDLSGGIPLLSVHNPRGSVTVEASAGNRVEIVVEKKITAQSAADLETGKREVQLVTEQRGDSILVYITAPQVRWCGNRYGCISFSDDDPYTFDLVMKVKVPRQTNLDISTVKGDVRITDVNGNIRAQSHQGLQLVNVAGKFDVSAHHGDLVAGFSAPLAANSSFKTHHGDVKLTLPGQPDADIVYDSYHGDLYTDFPDVKALPVEVTASVDNGGQGRSYKLEKNKTIRMGKGGVKLRFQSHHGSFYLMSRK